MLPELTDDGKPKRPLGNRYTDNQEVMMVKYAPRLMDQMTRLMENAVSAFIAKVNSGDNFASGAKGYLM